METFILLSLVVAQIAKVPARRLSRCPMGKGVTFIHCNLYLKLNVTLDIVTRHSILILLLNAMNCFEFC